jgi:GxxExxY protein
MHADERGCAPIDLLTEKVIGAAYKVANALGCGFLEKVYENALAHELRKVGFHVEQQKTIDVYYDGAHVGYYVSDLFVEHQLPVELKVAKALDDAHFAQALNFLKSSGFKVGLLLNSGTSKVGIKRVVNNY